MSGDIQATLIERTHSQLASLPTLLDAKISILTATSIGCFLYDFGIIRTLDFVGSGGNMTEYLLFFFMAGASLGCSAAIFSCFGSLWARSSGRSQSLSSFVGIAGRPTGAEYFAELIELTERQALKELAIHSHELAHIALAKVRWANAAIISLSAGIFFTAAASINMAST